MRCWLFIALALLVSGCERGQNTALVPISYAQLPGWPSTQASDALPALKRSCGVILRQPPSKPMITGPDKGGISRDWHPFCQALINYKDASSLEFSRFLEERLKPYQLTDSGETVGRFTGYYEPILRGSRHRHGRYQTPLYKFPPRSLRGFSRSQIVKGALKGKNLELVWVDDPIGAFFLQIQGSGKIILHTGETLRVGYAGQNGHPYVPIGRKMVERGLLSLSEVSMQSIRHWLEAHPRQAESIMSLNPSYVYFKINPSGHRGPVGAYGVSLTPNHSLAIDPRHISLGTPLWLDSQYPLSATERFQTLLSAQDTGGAIKGPLRGDVFWGSGQKAALQAGHMNAQGSLYLLLPR